MALMHCDFFSETLGVCTSMYVILPQQTRGQIGLEGRGGNGRHPTLYLLHGMSDDHTIWLRRTSIERYAAPLGLAVVMPAAGRSYYTDQAHGYRYFSFLSEELPDLARSFFPLSDRREDNFVAGLSMGGYGAFKWALRCPDRFAAAASLSGALDIAGRAADATAEFRDTFGDPERVAGGGDDLFELARRVAADGPKPVLYQCCGTEDFLYGMNERFRDHCRSLPALSLTYEEEPGAHEWGYWDRKIQRVLEWLPLRTRG